MELELAVCRGPQGFGYRRLQLRLLLDAAGFCVGNVEVMLQECFKLSSQARIFDNHVPVTVALAGGCLIRLSRMIYRVHIGLVGVVPVSARQPHGPAVTHGHFDVVRRGENPAPNGLA